MFRFLRPRMRVGSNGPVYGLGPLIDTWGAARLIYEKQYTYPLDNAFGPGIQVARQYRITQPPPVFVNQRALVSGISGIPVGAFYSTPVSSPQAPGDYTP